jgi:uncharacterized protein YbgA (DUF1722 family)/uncharacterized protein YbbK (DUF523 family)
MTPPRPGWQRWHDETEPIRIGISSCLLGQKVRFDGGHKRDGFIVGTLARLVEFVPVCPEVELGLGTPREIIRIERRDDGLRLVAPKSGLDHTRSMQRYAKRRVAEIGRLDLSGYIVKKDSPSCGMERVKIWDRNRVPAKSGRGFFTAALMEAMPLLPVEEEGRLHDPRLRENFFERVFAHERLRRAFRPRWRLGDLVRFHTAEKLLLLAHDPKAYRDLGRLVAGAKQVARAELAERYQHDFMTALARKATVGRHTNVLQHMAGYLKKLVTPEEKSEIGAVIADFRAGLIPLIVPLTLLRHYARVHGIDYLTGQTYVDPTPKELMLRNHV